MIKKNIKVLILTSVVVLLPILIGAILWNQLPEQMPIHWNASGEVDGFSSKAVAVFALPLFLLVMQWFVVTVTLLDPKKQGQSPKLLQLVFWILPILSVIVHLLVYATALGKEVRVEVLIPSFMGILFAIIGNYMPKCKQNYTIGLKLPWTLHSEKNWNRTHRLAGWLWMICGLAIIPLGFLGILWPLFAVLGVMIAVPILYSYVLYRKGI